MVGYSSGFYARLKRKREKAGLTQKALAKKLGITSAAVSRWEGADGMPTSANLERLADVLNTSVDYFLNRYPNEDEDSADEDPAEDTAETTEEDPVDEDTTINEIALEARTKMAAALKLPLEAIRLEVKLRFPLVDA